MSLRDYLEQVYAHIALDPGIVPYGADQTAYIVVDSIGERGTARHEIEIERTELETIISEFLSGQFNDPIRVIAFNTLEHWCDDVSKDVAAEIQTRCDMDGIDVPEHIRDFVMSHSKTHQQPAHVD